MPQTPHTTQTSQAIQIPHTTYTAQTPQNNMQPDMNTGISLGKGISLAKGGGVSLSKNTGVSLAKIDPTLRNVMLGVGWDVNITGGYPYDLDIQAFMLGPNEKVVNDAFFVFYNQPVSPDGSIRHYERESDFKLAIDDKRYTPQMQNSAFQNTKEGFQQMFQNFGNGNQFESQNQFNPQGQSDMGNVVKGVLKNFLG